MVMLNAAHVEMASPTCSPAKKRRKIRNHDLQSLKVLEGAAVSDAKAGVPQDVDELWFFQLPKDVSRLCITSLYTRGGHSHLLC